MVRSAFVALAVLVTACSDGRQLVTHDEAVDIADDAASEDEARIAELEARLSTLEDRADAQGRVNDTIAAYVDQVDEKVVNNAKAMNRNTLADATARGDCGTELVRTEGGVLHNRKIECTAENYFRK